MIISAFSHKKADHWSHHPHLADGGLPHPKDSTRCVPSKVLPATGSRQASARNDRTLVFAEIAMVGHSAVQ